MEIVIDGLNRNLEKMNKSLEIKHTGEDRGRVFFFAVKLIMKSEYVCEYNTTAVLKEKKNEELQREYELNNDEASCTIEAKVQGKKMFFDATRHMDQFGRYINHVARGCNVQPHPPLFVRGKWRDGFYATTNISPGEELFWDYGCQDSEIPWMSAEYQNKELKIPKTQCFAE